MHVSQLPKKKQLSRRARECAHVNCAKIPLAAVPLGDAILRLLPQFRARNSSGKPKADRIHAATEPPTSRSSPHFGHDGFLNTILSGVKTISSCQVLPQSGHSNFSGRICCITIFDDPRREKVGFFAPSCYPVRSRSASPFPARLLHLFGSTRWFKVPLTLDRFACHAWSTNGANSAGVPTSNFTRISRGALP
jgi:hypothetical protein